MKEGFCQEESHDFNLRLGESRFIPEKFGTISSKEYRVSHRNINAVLNYLKRTAIRTGSNYDLGLYNRFWVRGYLVSTKSLRDLSSAFGYSSMCQMRVMIDKLVKTGEIYIAKVNVGTSKPQNVYVVGIHNGRIKEAFEELYFTEIVFNDKLDKTLDGYLTEFGVDKKLVKW